MEDSEVIRKAIGIKNKDFHGTTFDRSEAGELSITFRLNKEITLQEIKDELNSHFWFEKFSKEGNLNKIRGCVVYPLMANEPANYTKKNEVKEISIEGSNYEINEEEILSWVQLYGDVKGEVEEEAVILNENNNNNNWYRSILC